MARHTFIDANRFFKRDSASSVGKRSRTRCFADEIVKSLWTMVAGGRAFFFESDSMSNFGALK